MIGNIIAAIVIGIIAGYLGRALLPGDDSMGFVATVVVGIVGALVGYFLFTSLLGIGDDRQVRPRRHPRLDRRRDDRAARAACSRRQRQGPRRPPRADPPSSSRPNRPMASSSRSGSRP